MNQLTLLFSQPWAERLGWTLLHFIWQGAAIALALAVARVWMTSPRARHTAACLALAVMTLAPALTFALLDSHQPAPAAATPTITAPIAAYTPDPAAAATPGLLPWLVIVWLVGVAVLSLRLAGGWISAARLRFSGVRPAPSEWQTACERLVQRMGVARPVRLMASPHVDVPAVLGWLRPIVLAPVAALSGLPPEHVEALLAHELAHIRRNDYLVNLLQSVVETVLFYHPAVWWVSAQIRSEREHCCDDLAIAVTGDVLTYARALAGLEVCRPSHARVALAADGGSLLQRIARLIDPARAQHTLPRPAAAWALSALLAIGVGTLAMRATAQVQSYPTVERDSIWMDTVKQGDMHVEVRGLGILVSPNLAEIKIAETQAKAVRVGQSVKIDLRGKQLLDGQITKVQPEPHNGTITVEVATGGLLPTLGRPPLDIDGSIHIRTLSNVVYVGRPLFSGSHSEAAIYRLEPGSNQAVLVKVQFGSESVNTIEVRGGLAPGDKIILSDMSKYKDTERVNLK
jgi:beta-lactamase regulating signal transducer with metallopeptidase domain